MALFQGLFFSAIGLGLLAITYQSLGRGWLPCGPNGFRGRVEVQRRTQPIAYWTLFAAYTLFALWVLKYGISILFGTVEPTRFKRYGQVGCFRTNLGRVSGRSAGCPG